MYIRVHPWFKRYFELIFRPVYGIDDFIADEAFFAFARVSFDDNVFESIVARHPPFEQVLLNCQLQGYTVIPRFPRM